MGRLRHVLWMSLVLAACGDDGGSGSGSATAPTTAMTGGDDAGPGTQGGTAAADTTGGITGDATGGVLTAGGATSDGTDDEGGLPTNENCRTPADCVLDDDCCHCALYGGSIPEPHGCAERACEQTTCAAWGIPDPEPMCVQGNCLLPKVPCHASAVTCDEAPPACAGGQAPQIVDGCYTQACIPFSACEEFAYFSCDECDPGEVCVRFSACAGDACSSWTACLPDPGAAVVNCATAGASLCAAFGAPRSQGYACYDEATGPFCCTGDAGLCASAG